MSKEERRTFRSLPAVERHRRLVARHALDESKKITSMADSMDEDIGFFSPEEEREIRKHHRFIRSEEEHGEISDTWAMRLAKRYYSRLFKEYCIVDLSLYEYGCLGTRWRTEKEVKDGKGQFICASTRCKETESLGTYEMNFSYSEDGVKKCALVKVRLCSECFCKTNYKRTVLKEKIDDALSKNSRKRRKRHSRDGNRELKKKKRIPKKPAGQAVDGCVIDNHQDNGSDSSDDCLDDLFL